MSRSGYIDDDCDNMWDHIRWRGAVASAIGGKRGQALLIEMRDALDAMPEKRLISSEIVAADGEVCAMGSVVKKRGLDFSDVDPEEPEVVAGMIGVSPAMVREISFENDENAPSDPAERWKYMRRWVERKIKAKA